MAKLEFTKEQLMDELLKYFTDEVESCPKNAKAFCDVFFYLYEMKNNEKDKVDSVEEKFHWAGERRESGNEEYLRG